MAEGGQMNLKELLDTPLELRCLRGGVRGGMTDKVAMFNKHADEHQQGQKRNPFSGQADGSHMVLDKHDPNYGRPIAGSLADIRGKKAMCHISKEMLELCEVIHESGHPIPDDNDHIYITFGELFNIYTNISNKVVGILLRARKHGYVQFEGEVLFQRRDDDVPIFLIKTIDEIRSSFRGGIAQTYAVDSYATVGGR